MSRSALALRPDEVHVWVAQVDPGEGARRRPPGEGLLPAEEREELDRVMVDAVRYLRAAGRVLRRIVLSRYADIQPDAWRFRAEPGGRPVIAAPAGAPPLSFSVTHTEGLVACAVTWAREVGVDAEAVGRPIDIGRLAARFFAPQEAAALERLDGPARVLAFFQHWTLKEAYLKARGLGLAVPLAAVVVRLQTGGGPVFAFLPPVEDDPAAWAVALKSPTDRHVLGVAARRAPETDLAVAVRWTEV